MYINHKPTVIRFFSKTHIIGKIGKKPVLRDNKKFPAKKKSFLQLDLIEQALSFLSNTLPTLAILTCCSQKLLIDVQIDFLDLDDLARISSA